MVSAIAKAGLRSTERRGFRLRSPMTRDSRVRGKQAKVWPKTFSSCPENRARFLEPLLRFPRLAHHARFCQVTDVGFAASALGTADRGGSVLSLEMPGPRGARLPSFRRGGRADRRSRGRDGRVDRVARGGCRAIRGGHYLERTSLAPGTAGNAPSRRERRRHAGRRRRRWRVRRPFLTGRVRTRLCARARAVMSRRSRPVRRSSWNHTEPSQRIESLSGLVPPDPAKKQQPSAPRRHQISGARRRACGDGAARGASSPRGG